MNYNVKRYLRGAASCEKLNKSWLHWINPSWKTQSAAAQRSKRKTKYIFEPAIVSDLLSDQYDNNSDDGCDVNSEELEYTEKSDRYGSSDDDDTTGVGYAVVLDSVKSLSKKLLSSISNRQLYMVVAFLY